MGIKLDWEFESERDWEEVGEDPALLDSRKRRNKRLLNLAIVVLVLAGIAFGIIRYRLYLIDRQLRADLESAIAGETLALRIGDQQAFLDTQSEIGAWNTIQEITFDTYQSLGDRLVPTGEIIDLDIDGDQARVVLQEQLDEQSYHITWFYQHGEQGWQHVAPASDLWGSQNRLETEHFTFTYYDADAALVEELSSKLDSWWALTCQATACQEGLPHLEVRIEPDPLTRLGWASYDDSTLLIPSPLLGRIPEGSPYDPQLESDLARLLTWRWTNYLIGGPVEAYSELDWLSVELQIWLSQNLDPTRSPSTFFDPMVAAYGSDFVPGFIERVRRGEPVVPALAAMTGTPANDLPVSWDIYLTYRLRGEAQLLANSHETEAMLLYGDPGRDMSAESVQVGEHTLLQEARPDSIQIVETQQIGEIVWAKVNFSSGESETGYVPFRLTGDRWARATLYDTDWGAIQETHSQHFVLQYRTLDAESVDLLLPHLEQVYGQVAADFAISTDDYPQTVISIQPNPVEPSLTNGIMRIASPYNTTRPVDQAPQDYIRSTASILLIESMITEQIVSLPDTHPLTGGFVIWEADRLKINAGMPLTQETGEGVPESLTQIWENDGNVTHVIGAAALLDILIETYGSEIIPTLIANLKFGVSLDDWLSWSVGITSADIEAEWRVRFTEWLNR